MRHIEEDIRPHNYDTFNQSDLWGQVNFLKKEKVFENHSAVPLLNHYTTSNKLFETVFPYFRRNVQIAPNCISEGTCETNIWGEHVSHVASFSAPSRVGRKNLLIEVVRFYYYHRLQC